METRICILGNSGSGKSSLANKLGTQLNIPVHHLDRELLYGKFDRYSDEHQLATHSKLISGQNWIIDGNYKNLSPERYERATLIVFINISRLTALKRVITRFLTSSQLRKSVPEDAPNTLTWTLLHWTAKYSRRERLKALQESLRQLTHVQLLVLNSGSLDDWVKQIAERL